MHATFDGGTTRRHVLLRPRRLPTGGDAYEVAPFPEDGGVVWHLAPRDFSLLPAGGEFTFATSGHTGRPRRWLRSVDQIRREIRLLAALADLTSCDGVVCFAPLEHIYGFIAGFCTAAELALPLWVVPPRSARRPPPDLPVRRPVVVALPATLTMLEREPRWLAAFARCTVVHSTARLPDAGVRLAAPPAALPLVELFGATETGLVAHRWPAAGAGGPWTLADDVDPVLPPGGGSGALVVASPRLARRPGRPPPAAITLGDEVRYTRDGRRFRFLGRASHLLDVGGRRVDLDTVELRLRQVIVCHDLACVPLRDELGGKSYDLVVVPRDDLPLTEGDVRVRAVAALGSHHAPRHVRLVATLPRSATGKVRLGEVAS